MNVLVINGNPKRNSLCREIADRYMEGLSDDVSSKSVIHLGDMRFDPVLREGYFGPQEIEPDLEEVIKLFCAADHLVFIYPNWWGAMPALLKGFLDRVLVPGVAFKFEDGIPVKLMAGKTASIIVTMDVPIPVYTDVYGSRGTLFMKENILEFCGIELKTTRYLGPVHSSNECERAEWLADVERLGRRAA